MEELKNNKLYSIEETIAKELFEICEYPWELLSKINNYILELGKKLDKEKFEKIGENIWIAKSAKVSPKAEIIGPAIIDENAEIRPFAYIRGNAIIGKDTVVGNSTEVKNAILFNGVKVPHFNYIGDSILGYKAHLGAGVILSNVRSDNNDVVIRFEGKKIETCRRKVGVMLGDFVEVGCNSVLNPGTVVGKNTMIYPMSLVRGVIKKDTLFKNP